MIARIWHGRTKKEDYEEYTDLMKSIAIPDYKNTKGFVDLTFLRRIENEIAHFTLITFWEDLEVIKNFAGEDFEKAKYYPEDERFLLEFEEKVIHNEVFAR
ncbi:MAG: antibiotic biosynthesis monooxygenase [Candidatus Paceibacterota bacterium]